MAIVDVIQTPGGRALIQIFGDAPIPSTVNFGGYYDGDCEITLGQSVWLEPCIVHRPASRESATGRPTQDWLVVLITKDLSADQLRHASIKIVRFGAEILAQSCPSIGKIE